MDKWFGLKSPLSAQCFRKRRNFNGFPIISGVLLLGKHFIFCWSQFRSRVRHSSVLLVNFAPLVHHLGGKILAVFSLNSVQQIIRWVLFPGNSSLQYILPLWRVKVLLISNEVMPSNFLIHRPFSQQKACTAFQIWGGNNCPHYLSAQTGNIYWSTSPLRTGECVWRRIFVVRFYFEVDAFHYQTTDMCLLADFVSSCSFHERIHQLLVCIPCLREWRFQYLLSGCNACALACRVLADPCLFCIKIHLPARVPVRTGGLKGWV